MAAAAGKSDRHAEAEGPTTDPSPTTPTATAATTERPSPTREFDLTPDPPSIAELRRSNDALLQELFGSDCPRDDDDDDKESPARHLSAKKYGREVVGTYLQGRRASEQLREMISLTRHRLEAVQTWIEQDQAVASFLQESLASLSGDQDYLLTGLNDPSPTTESIEEETRHSAESFGLKFQLRQENEQLKQELQRVAQAIEDEQSGTWLPADNTASSSSHSWSFYDLLTVLIQRLLASSPSTGPDGTHRHHFDDDDGFRAEQVVSTDLLVEAHPIHPAHVEWLRKNFLILSYSSQDPGRIRLVDYRE